MWLSGGATITHRRVDCQTIAQQPYRLVLVSAHGVQPEDASVTIQERLLAEVGGHRGAGAADRLCQVCVSVLDVTLIPDSPRMERVDHDPSTPVEPSRRTHLLVARNRGENNHSRPEPDAKHA
ncbi:MAG: hypothetical protein QOD10_4243 [Mycobacterium sp.]|jgi:hypothetical protein|nr:hypothetical protein [Mycobacterium sp.]MDT5259163.1 hypothetical protein [Mycobacterium sp.]